MLTCMCVITTVPQIESREYGNAILAGIVNYMQLSYLDAIFPPFYRQSRITTVRQR